MDFVLLDERYYVKFGYCHRNSTCRLSVSLSSVYFVSEMTYNVSSGTLNPTIPCLFLCDVKVARG